MINTNYTHVIAHAKEMKIFIDITKAQAMRISKFPFTTLTKNTKKRIRSSIGGAKLNEWGKLNATIKTRKSNVCKKF